MAKAPNAFEYPLVIKQHLNFIVFSIPDLGISVVEDIPKDGKIDIEYMQKMTKTLAKTWLKAAERIQSIQNTKTKPPRPSSTRQAISEKEDRGLGTPEVARVLGVSENTVRRMVERGHLSCEKTDGGHRRFLESEVKKFIDSEQPLY